MDRSCRPSARVRRPCKPVTVARLQRDAERRMTSFTATLLPVLQRKHCYTGKVMRKEGRKEGRKEEWRKEWKKAEKWMDPHNCQLQLPVHSNKQVTWAATEKSGGSEDKSTPDVVGLVILSFTSAHDALSGTSTKDRAASFTCCSLQVPSRIKWWQ